MRSWGPEVLRLRVPSGARSSARLFRSMEPTVAGKPTSSCLQRSLSRARSPISTVSPSTQYDGRDNTLNMQKVGEHSDALKSCIGESFRKIEHLN